MSYRYEEQKPELFTDEGQRTLAGETGSIWFHMACVDRLVEIGDLREVPTNGWAQHRIFTRKE